MSDLNKDKAVLEWFANGEVGQSSKSIALFLSGIRQTKRWGVNVPYDVADLRRCMLMLDAIPGFHDRMPEMREASAEWAKMVEYWPQIVSEYRSEEGLSNRPKTYQVLLQAQGRA